VFHAAAVCDFRFGAVWQTDGEGGRKPIQDSKLSTRSGRLLVELLPTPKLIAELRDLFPEAWLVGWKYEVEGERTKVFEAAERQLRECRTDACVANGPAYGPGYGLISPGETTLHLDDTDSLFDALLKKATA
jgi:phosphopantothenoylcysteine decarboxylase/phosphopantothenate--cysteine ligase